MRRLRRAVERELARRRGSTVAMTARGSIAAPTRRLLTRSSATVCAAERNAATHAASSPRAQRKQTLPGAHVVQLRRAGRLRGARVGDGGQRLVVHRDALGGIRRLRAGSRRSPPRPARRHGARCSRASAKRGGSAIGEPSRERTDPQRPHRRHAVRRHVGAGEHGDDAGRGDAPPPHRSGECAHGRAASARERNASAPGSVDVGHEAPAAEQKAPILDAAQRRADALWRVGSGRCVHSGATGMRKRLRRPCPRHWKRGRALHLTTATPRAPGRAARTPICR